MRIKTNMCNQWIKQFKYNFRIQYKFEIQYKNQHNFKVNINNSVYTMLRM